MEINALFKKIKELIATNKNLLKDTLDKIEKNKLLKQKINELEVAYSVSNIFNVNLFVEICNGIEYIYGVKVQYDLDKINEIINTLNNLRQTNSQIFVYQIEKCNEELKKHIILLHESINVPIVSKETVRKELEFYDAAETLILNDNFNGLMDQKKTDLFLQLLDKCQLESQEKLFLIMELSKSNVKIIQEDIKESLVKTTNQSSSKSFNFYDCLKKIDEEKLDVCIQIENKLLELKKNIIDDYKGEYDYDKYSEIFNKYTKLTALYSVFRDATELYSTDPSQFNRQMFDSYYDDLTDAYLQILKISESIIPSDEIVQTGSNFYSDSHEVKNIYVFLDDNDSPVSNVELEMINDRNINSSSISNVLMLLKNNIDSDHFEFDSVEVKSDNYSSKFLNKYKVKSKLISNTLFFFSKFKTNFKIDSKNNVNIIFVIKIKGSSNNDKKRNDIFASAIKECYDKRDQIDYIVDLLNTDFSSLTPDEALRKREEIETLLNRQILKLNHLSNTYSSSKGEK